MAELVIERPSVLENTFYCRARRKKQTLDKCLDDYVNANAFEDRGSACWRCPQGRGNRTDFQVSDDEEDDDSLVLGHLKPTTPVNRARPPVVPRPESSAPSPPPQADTELSSPADHPSPQSAPADRLKPNPLSKTELVSSMRIILLVMAEHVDNDGWTKGMSLFKGLEERLNTNWNQACRLVGVCVKCDWIATKRVLSGPRLYRATGKFSEASDASVDAHPPPSADHPPSQPTPADESVPPDPASAPNTSITTEEERRKPMKPTERAKKLPFPERVRLAWGNTPGETVTEKCEYLFLRNATDVLQKIFGLNSAASAQQFINKLRDEGMFTGDGGSYCWANDMGDYGLAKGDSGDGVDDDDDNQNKSGDDAVADGDESTGQSAQAKSSSEAFASLTAKKPWIATVIAAADMLSGLSPEQYFAVRAVFAGLKVPPSHRKQALQMLDAIMLAPLEESEED